MPPIHNIHSRIQHALSHHILPISLIEHRQQIQRPVQKLPVVRLRKLQKDIQPETQNAVAVALRVEQDEGERVEQFVMGEGCEFGEQLFLFGEGGGWGEGEGEGVVEVRGYGG
jgi:hypothetical protein